MYYFTSSFFFAFFGLLKTLLKTFLYKTFSSDDDLKSKLVENSKKINNYKEISLFVLIIFYLIYIYIHLHRKSICQLSLVTNID